MASCEANADKGRSSGQLAAAVDNVRAAPALLFCPESGVTASRFSHH
jgi:hypothetical protein